VTKKKLSNLKSSLVAEDRHYRVTTVAQARNIVTDWLKAIGLNNALQMGLPEIDDRHHIWRVGLRNGRKSNIGEVVINAFTTEVNPDKTTKPELLETRLLHKPELTERSRSNPSDPCPISKLRNTIGQGNCVELIDQMPTGSVDLIFTSPPYFNARPEYTEYEAYEEYLLQMRKVIHRCARVLSDGRFFVMNSSPILLRRASRNEASRRIAVPFDLHRIFIEEGFDFIDDIIWVKPEGAGWATGRGRRFAADRNPLQYKAVPVTEYVMVYRKRTDRLIDWHIRNHPDKQVVRDSKIPDGYEKTNIWRISPSTRSKHPAAFPIALAERVIKYYSFKGDVVLDPFAGSGTVGAAASKLSRRFALFEINPAYIKIMQAGVVTWLGKDSDQILWIGCEPPAPSLCLL